jgi:hypothetical protein
LVSEKDGNLRGEVPGELFVCDITSFCHSGQMRRIKLSGSPLSRSLKQREAPTTPVPGTVLTVTTR